MQYESSQLEHFRLIIYEISGMQNTYIFYKF